MVPLRTTVSFETSSGSLSEAAQVRTVVPGFRVNGAYRTPEALHCLFRKLALIDPGPQRIEFASPSKAGPVAAFLDEKKLGTISASYKLVPLRGERGRAIGAGKYFFDPSKAHFNILSSFRFQ